MFGENVRATRENAGLSMEELAERMKKIDSKTVREGTRAYGRNIRIAREAAGLSVKELAKPDEFLKLANLVRPSKIRRQGGMPEGFLVDNGNRVTATLPGDISYDVDLSCIAELARKTGPLFGTPKEKSKRL